jgi:hypothetical protein
MTSPLENPPEIDLAAGNTTVGSRPNSAAFAAPPASPLAGSLEF